MSTKKGAPTRPARISVRLVYQDVGEREAIDFAKRREAHRAWHGRVVWDEFVEAIR